MNWFNGFCFGIVVGMVFMVSMVALYPYEPYTDCAEDEVWTWHMNYRPSYPDNLTWECVSVDDLLITHNP